MDLSLSPAFLAVSRDSQSPALLLFLLSTCLVCIVASILWFRNSRNAALPLPPGPSPWPIIGNLHLLGELPHRSLYRLSKIHGPLMSLRLGSVPAVVVSSPAMAREVLRTHDLAFASRPRTAAAVNMLDCADISFAPYGPYWKLMRQICARDLFSNKRIEFFRPIREEEVNVLLREVLEDSKMGRQVRLISRLSSTANNIISRMVLGRKFSELEVVGGRHEDPSKNIIATLTEMAQLLGVFNVGDYIPFVQWMDVQGYERRMKIVGKNIKVGFQGVIDSRRDLQKMESGSPNDLLDVLLQVSKENRGDIPITDDNIKAVLLDMFAAGTETSATSVEWALAELLRNPNMLKKAQNELDSVVGKGRLVRESDIMQLPYLRAVVKETLRLHTVAPLVSHESIQACQVAGYYVPAKTVTLLNLWAIGMDDSAWVKPMEFSPERFLESSVDVGGQHFELLPFSSGRRGCPGWTLGLLNVQLMLASLVHGFEWSLPAPLEEESKMEVNMSEKFGLVVHMKVPLLAMAAPRLAEDLYYTSP